MKNSTRREVLLWIARVAAALGLSGLGVKLGLNDLDLPADGVPHQEGEKCRGCLFRKSTCVPGTPTCRKEADK